MLARPSLRVQWILSIAVAAIAVVALVVLVDRSNSTANSPAPPLNRSVIVEENREAEIIQREDQAPHVVALPAGHAPLAALTAAVRDYMQNQVARGFIPGPIERASCTSRGGSAARAVFGCSVEAADVNYPFDGVIAVPARQITYCKVDYAPVARLDVPVSGRCT